MEGEKNMDPLWKIEVSKKETERRDYFRNTKKQANKGIQPRACIGIRRQEIRRIKHT
jgi:hypothetical protein